MQPQTVCERLRAFLDDNDIRYVSIGHSPAFTAQELAARVHVPGRTASGLVGHGDGPGGWGAGRAVAETDCGPIEFAMLGEGDPVLVVHGILGGFDQAVLDGAAFANG